MRSGHTRCRPTNCTRSRPRRRRNRSTGRMARRSCTHCAVPAGGAVLGNHEQQGTRSRCGPTTVPTARSACCSGTAKSRPPGSSLNPFAFTPLVALWTWQAGAVEPRPWSRCRSAVSCALSYVIMAGAAWQAAGDDASWLWLFACSVVITIGELYSHRSGCRSCPKSRPRAWCR